MASYWQTAKREAKKRAQLEGYCWVWSNPNLGATGYWKNPYLFHTSSVTTLPPWVPTNAHRFGEGPYVQLEPAEPSDRELIDLLNDEMRELKRLLRFES